MKNTKAALFAFFALLSVLAFLACERELLQDDSNHLTTLPKEKDAISKKNYDVMQPIKATFSTFGGIVGTCGDSDFPFLNVQDTDEPGIASHLGRFTSHMEFCVLPVFDENYPGDITKATIYYGDISGSLVAANGDEIFLDIEGTGVITPTTRPGYVFEFKDKILIVGGTGRFQGASGYMWTDSYNDGMDRTDHVWTGMIKISN